MVFAGSEDCAAETYEGLITIPFSNIDIQLSIIGKILLLIFHILLHFQVNGMMTLCTAEASTIMQTALSMTENGNMAKWMAMVFVFCGLSFFFK